MAHPELFRRTCRRAVGLMALTLLACLGFPACLEGEPTVFSRGETIPLGEGSLRIYQAEMTSQFLPSNIGALTGMTHAVVAFTYQTPRLKEKTIIEKMKLIRGLSLTLVDDTGKKLSTPAAILPADQYRMILAGKAMVMDMEAMDSYLQRSTTQIVPDDFVAIFVVPRVSKALTVRFYNPSPQAGQARLGAVTVW